jgi:hypothetical protein
MAFRDQLNIIIDTVIGWDGKRNRGTLGLFGTQWHLIKENKIYILTQISF